MEALVALGFAANVVQFVEFATKVVSQTIRIHRARLKFGHGEDELDLYQIGDRIEQYVAPLIFHPSVKPYLTQSATGRLFISSAGKPFVASEDELKKFLHDKAAAPQLRGAAVASHIPLSGAKEITNLSASDKEIFRICIKCDEVAHRLQEALKELRKDSALNQTKWNSFIEALKFVWTESEIEDMRSQLEYYRQQMTTLLLVSVREKVEALQVLQHAHHKDLFEMTRMIRSKLNTLFVAQGQWKSEVLEAIRSSPKQQGILDATYQPLSVKTETDNPSAELQRFETNLRKWISFAEMDYRGEKITKAHEETFEWIYRAPDDDKWSDFTKWLQSEAEHMYWITAKAAAGKSTLLKFIQNDGRTAERLRVWAGNKKLISCDFYFWHAGTPMQTCEEGLQRTLLHSALLQAPELWAVIFPAKMEELILFGEPWSTTITTAEVELAFQRLIKGAGKDYRLFIFIDGLDEFRGDYNRLLCFVRSLPSVHVKTCVSSRPWPVFEDEFRSYPKLRLEDLTDADIKIYVAAQFAGSQGYLERRKESPNEIDDLINSIVQKASGVFLWVKLVTRSLLDGFTSGDRLSELEERLAEIPVDLEDLFWRILTQVDEKYRMSMSQHFQIMKDSVEPLTILDMSYADDPDPDIVSKTPPNYRALGSTEARARTMQRRLKTCCKGLLEAESTSNQPFALSTVAYLHRTVKDYIVRDEIWSQFLSMTGENFKIHSRFYNMHAIQAKAYKSDEERFKKAITYAMDRLVLAYPINENEIPLKLLIQVDDIGICSAGGKLSLDGKHWSSFTKETRLNTSFAHLAMQRQWYNYVRWAVSVKPSPTTETPYDHQNYAILLLMATLRCHTTFGERGVPNSHPTRRSPDMELFALILESGADPNHLVEGALLNNGNITGSYTAWGAHLRDRNRKSPIWIEMSTMFLEHGADPSQIRKDAVHWPEKIAVLAQQKAKEKKEETRKASKTAFIGSIFKVGKWRGSAGPGVARTR